MERLTIDYGEDFRPFRYAMKDGSDAEIGYFKNYDAFYSHMLMVQKLGEYETAEEQGLLLRLPVKPGDIVYIISTARRFYNEIIPLKVHGIDIRKDDFTILAKNEKYSGYSISNLYGKKESVDWFLTQTEAEQKLNEMESD